MQVQMMARDAITVRVAGYLLALACGGVLAGVLPPRAGAQPPGQATAPDAELSARKAERAAASTAIAQIDAVIALIDSIDRIPIERAKRETRAQAYRLYLQYVEGLDPALAGFAVGAEAVGIISAEDMKKGLQKTRARHEQRVGKLDGEIRQLLARIHQAQLEDLARQAQVPPGGGGGGGGGGGSQPGPPQPSTYTASAPPSPPGPGGPPALPPGAYLMGFQVSCPGHAPVGQLVTCTAIGVFSHDPYTAVDLTVSTDWRIAGASEWKGSSFRKRDPGTVRVVAILGQHRVTRTVVVGAGPGKPGPGKKGCGPGTSCPCAGGGAGHISCDTGQCHCGAG